MHQQLNLKFSVTNPDGFSTVQCFGVMNNCRINFPVKVDFTANLVNIEAVVDPRWLIVVDTGSQYFELEASEWL